MGFPGDPQGVNESYPTPNSGIFKAVEVRLAGVPALTQYTLAAGPAGGSGSAGGPQYTVTLSLSGTNIMFLTATIEDVDGNPVGVNHSCVWISYNAHPNAADFAAKNPTDVVESYPPKLAGQLGDICEVTSTGQLTGTVFAKNIGEAIVECQFPFGDNTIGNDQTTGDPINMVYAQVRVVVDK
jgi:hypothetical protein